MTTKARSPGRGDSLGKLEAQVVDEHGSDPVVKSWDKRASFHEPGPINGLGVVLQHPGSETGHSSVVRDGGDAQRLQLKNQPEFETPSQRVDQSTLLNVGASFDQESTQETFVGLDEDYATAQTFHGEQTQPLSLNELIRRSTEHAASERLENRHFLPLNKLDKLITLEAVCKELPLHQHFKSKTPVELDALAHAICDETSPTISPGKAGDLTTRKRIFATLILMERADAIELFIQDDLFDVHLPFQLPTDHYGNVPLYWKSTGDGDEASNPIALFSAWKYHEREMFEKYQWQFLAPFFHFIRRPQHYVLQDGIILPFVEDLEGKGHEPIISGGFSEVWRVRIHDAHYSHPSSNNPNFAVKRLRQTNTSEQMFKREVATLKRLSCEQDHPHLMRLELTYLWKDCYHLLFRWADGNLKNYWETYREPHQIPRTQPYAIWVAEQLLGLTQGLEAIHLCPPDDESDEDEGSRDPLAAQRVRGRHGDLKPENILWFQDDGQGQHGRLVISDFGLTQFHREHTGVVDAKSTARSPTYRPPEFDIRDQITQSFDIWTWGCVLLEFAVWYLRGYRAWDEFSMERTEEHRGGGPFPEDNYFQMEPRETFVIAKMKPSVIKQFLTLRGDRNIPQFLVDLLDLIEGKLLRMCPEHRAKCDDIVKDLRTIHDKCLESHEYCVLPVPGSPPVRADTNLSELTPRISKFNARRPSASSPDRHTMVRFLTPVTPGQTLPAFESSLREADSDGATTYADNTDDEGHVTTAEDDPGEVPKPPEHTSARDQADLIQPPALSTKPASETTTTDLAPSNRVPEMVHPESQQVPKKTRRWRERLFSCFLA